MRRANIFFCILFAVSGCRSLDPRLVKSADGYQYAYKGQQLTVVLGEPYKTQSNVSQTEEMLRFLLDRIPFKRKQHFYIEGLTDDLFYNFHLAGEELFFSQQEPAYHNKMLIYGYLAFLYSQFLYNREQISPIPLESFNELFIGQKFSRKEYNFLIDTAVDFAVREIFFVSILEFFERQARYFYPAKTKEELYRVLIYPEILSFWQYLDLRFGRKLLLRFAEQPYSLEEFKGFLGEPVSDIEASYVKKIQSTVKKSPDRQKDWYPSYLQLLEVYMSGTKKSLMRE